MTKPDNDPSANNDEPSKSDIKREALKLQELGKRIYELSNKERAQLSLNPELVKAFEEAKRISNKEALRRHFQYVGKLIRNTDAALLESALENLKSVPLEKSRQILALESFTTELIQKDIELSESFMEQHPNTDRKKLRQLIRNAKKQTKADEVPPFKNNSARKLLEYLKQHAL